MRAFELRKAGASYREISRQLGSDLHTIHGDVAAELAALRDRTVEQAQEVRDLELQRFDEMTAGLWPQVRAGSPPHVTAAVRVSERRSRLLGLDAPVVTKSELTGALSVSAQKIAAEKELFMKLDLHQLEALAAESQALVDRAMAMVKTNALSLDSATAGRVVEEYVDRNDAPAAAYPGAAAAHAGDGDAGIDADRAQARTISVAVGVSPSPAGHVDDVATSEPGRAVDDFGGH